MTRSLPVCAVLVVALVAGCSDSPAVPATTAAPAPTPSASAVAEDLPGATACGKVSAATRDGTLMQPGVVTDVNRATATADAPVADAAARLQEAYERAVRARGSEDEPDLVAAVSAAAAEMVSVCDDSGLETAG